MKAIYKPQKLTIVFYDLNLGGIQKKIIDIVNYLNQNYPQIKINLILQHKQGIFINQIPKNIPIYTPKIHHKPDFIFFTIWLTRQFSKLKSNTILTFMDNSANASIIASKLIFWQHPKIIIGEDIFTSKQISKESYPNIRLKLIKKFYPKANKILVQTPVQKKDLSEIIGKQFSSKIKVNPNWLPLEYSTKKPKRLKKIDILFVGRFDPQKNLFEFLQIITTIHTQNPKLNVCMVGNGPDLKIIKKEAKKLKLPINFIKSTPLVKNFYNQSKIFLLTSNYEGFPLTLLEAISCDCFPIVKNIREVSLFFNKYHSDIVYNHPNQATNLINIYLKSPSKVSKIVAYYQNKIFLQQQQNLTKYINSILKV